MKNGFENILPAEIEKRSFEIIEQELCGRILEQDKASIIKRVIHTTADFEYLDSLVFSEDVVEQALAAIKRGAYIVTDTEMGKAGINKKVLAKYGGEVLCYMADEEVAEIAKVNGITRATASIDKAALLDKEVIFAIGNAPTALIRIFELIEDKKMNPALIIGVPVGFVNVVQSKELIIKSEVPYIVARGRKGGSNVAAAICNALLYSVDETRGA